MPTPIAHGIAAWATARTAEPTLKAEPWLFALVAFLAIAPDLDFLPGIVVGRPTAFHRGPTHSLAGAFIAAAAIAWVLSRVSLRYGRQKGPGWWFAIVAPTYFAHLALDLVMPDTRGAAGIPLLWPLSWERLAAPIPLPEPLRGFVDLELGTGNSSFVDALLSGHGLAVFVVEGVLFIPLLLAPRLIGSIRKRIHGPGLGSTAREQPET